MKAILLAAALAILPLTAPPQPSSDAPANVSSERLTEIIRAGAGQDDEHLAAQLSSLALTESLSEAYFAQLSAMLPGDKSRQALLIMADSAAFLEPARTDLVANPQPDAAALRQMLVNLVNYANNALHGLPNFVATRTTTSFEDRPQEDVLEATGTVSYSYLPLHFVSRESAPVGYRDGREVVETHGRANHKSSSAHGLRTSGEFGSFLNTVLADAVKGKITWARWEQGTGGTNAVFHFEVPRDGSHYLVQFCCIREDSGESIARHVYGEKTGYEGEIAFNPATGAVMRIKVQAVLTPEELVAGAGMVVEYAPLQVGQKTVVLPVKSISILKAHTAAPPPGMHMAIFKGPAKTFLNDVVFEDYHEFRGEMRMVSDGTAAPPQ